MNIMTLVNALPGSVAQGLIWGILAIGVYITYKILDFADLTVDGSLGTGGAVAVVLIVNGCPVPLAIVCAFLAGCLAGLVTGLLNTLLGIPGILAGILTQLALYSINLDIMGQANTAINVDKYPLFMSLRFIPMTILKGIVAVALLIAILYWFFGTEYGFTIRATGCNSNMARAQGINTKKSTVIALILSNGLVGLAGGLLAQYQPTLIWDEALSLSDLRLLSSAKFSVSLSSASTSISAADLLSRQSALSSTSSLSRSCFGSDFPHRTQSFSLLSSLRYSSLFLTSRERQRIHSARLLKIPQET